MCLQILRFNLASQGREWITLFDPDDWRSDVLWQDDAALSGMKQLKNYMANEPGCLGQGGIKEATKEVIDYLFRRGNKLGFYHIRML